MVHERAMQCAPALPRLLAYFHGGWLFQRVRCCPQWELSMEAGSRVRTPSAMDTDLENTTVTGSYKKQQQHRAELGRVSSDRVQIETTVRVYRDAR